MKDLRYPIGAFEPPVERGAERRVEWIQTIEDCPRALRAAVAGLGDSQLDTPYRPEGWTVRQVVHHLPDSHMNSYIRFKLAMTEDTPTIRGYEEAVWAELPEAQTGPVEMSLVLLEALHARWVAFLRNLGDADWKRGFRHPEHPKAGVIPLDVNLALYAWHCEHHVAHITALRERMGW